MKLSNPIKQIYQYLDDDLKYGNRIDANMCYTGKVMFDKVNITLDLKKRAKEDLSIWIITETNVLNAEIR